jgi:hypothetical protein
LKFQFSDFFNFKKIYVKCKTRFCESHRKMEHFYKNIKSSSIDCILTTFKKRRDLKKRPKKTRKKLNFILINSNFSLNEIDHISY